MMLADRLKLTLSQVMELTTLEIDMWLAYIKAEADASNKQMQKMKQQGNRRR